jgi:hypothetical protein
MPASICPRNATGAPSEPDFGYNPAVDAIVERVEAGLGSSCVTELSADVATTLSCRVLEVGQTTCDCARPGRRAIADDIESAVADELSALCAARGDACDSYCACEIEPLTGTARDECMTSLTPEQGDGWCYISPSQGIGSQELVEHCPANGQRTVRVVGGASQLQATELRLLCL